MAAAIGQELVNPPNVKGWPGVHGPNPDLSKLTDGGDLIHQIDFRSVYAAILKQWFGADPARILEGVVPFSGLLA